MWTSGANSRSAFSRPRRPMANAPSGSLDQAGERLAQRGRVVRRHDLPVHAGFDQLGDAAQRRADDREPGRERLQHRERHVLVPARRDRRDARRTGAAPAARRSAGGRGSGCGPPRRGRSASASSDARDGPSPATSSRRSARAATASTKHVDALLLGEPSREHHVAAGCLLRRERVQVDEVGDPAEPVGEHLALAHLAQQELARAREDADRRVRASERVQRHLHRVQRARRRRAAVAAADDRLPEPMGEAALADLAVVHEPVRRARELVVVQRHHRRDAAAAHRLQDRRRELVVDVVEVHDVGPEVVRAPPPCPCAADVDHSSRPLPRRRPARSGGGGSKSTCGREPPLVPGSQVLRMPHREEGHVVAGGLLQGGDVQHVALGAASAVQELVDVQDLHGVRGYSTDQLARPFRADQVGWRFRERSARGKHGRGSNEIRTDPKPGGRPARPWHTWWRSRRSGSPEPPPT